MRILDIIQLAGGIQVAPNVLIGTKVRISQKLFRLLDYHTPGCVATHYTWCNDNQVGTITQQHDPTRFRVVFEDSGRFSDFHITYLVYA